jgi:hypothetical protein
MFWADLIVSHWRKGSSAAETLRTVGFLKVREREGFFRRRCFPFLERKVDRESYVTVVSMSPSTFAPVRPSKLSPQQSNEKLLKSFMNDRNKGEKNIFPNFFSILHVPPANK